MAGVIGEGVRKSEGAPPPQLCLLSNRRKILAVTTQLKQL